MKQAKALELYQGMRDTIIGLINSKVNKKKFTYNSNKLTIDYIVNWNSL